MEHPFNLKVYGFLGVSIFFASRQVVIYLKIKKLKHEVLLRIYFSAPTPPTPHPTPPFKLKWMFPYRVLKNQKNEHTLNMTVL